MTRLPGLSAYDQSDDATPQARRARAAVAADNREPSTRRGAIGGGGCWCGEPNDHDWPGKADGAAHPQPDRRAG